MTNVRQPLVVFVSSLALVVGACGSDSDDAAPADDPTTTTAPESTTSVDAATAEVDVYLVDQDAFASGTEPYVKAVTRSVAADDPIQGAIDALFEGPTPEETATNLALVASSATGATVMSVEGGVARVQLLGGCASGGSTLTVAAEIVPTLKQFDEVDVVKVLDPEGTTIDDASDMDSTPECLEP